jgi:peptide/nickel transport system permease protein
MTKYVIRRVAQAIPVLFGISIAVYAILLAAPGGPTAKFAQNPRMTLEQKEAFKRAWGLDQPIPIQYCRWLGVCNPEGDGLGIFLGPSGWPNFLPTAISGATNGVLHGDFGYSIDSGEPVMDRIARAALPTLILASFALVIWLAIAIIIGVVAAVRRYSLFDQAATIFAYVGFAMPTFWLGIMLIYIFSGPGLNWLPAGGITTTRLSPPFGSDAYWTYFGQNPLAAMADIGKHLILPVITLVTVSVAGDSRFVRASMLEALNQDYVRTAKAKGLSGKRVLLRHVLRNSLIPIVTLFGLDFAAVLGGGAILTETVFDLKGVGWYAAQSVGDLDLPPIMGITLYGAFFIVVFSTLVDVIYAYLDPRIRLT